MTAATPIQLHELPARMRLLANDMAEVGAAIRYFGGFPEGVTFAILIMNTCAWFLDKLNPQRQFGVSKDDLKAAKAAAKAAKKAEKEAV